MQVQQLPRTDRLRVQAERKRIQVAVEHFLLLVGQSLEAGKHLVELGLARLMAEIGQALAQRVAAGMLAEHELGAREADVLGPHDLVGLAMLEHAVLVDAGLVRERVVADDGLVARDGRADDVGEQARGRVQQRRADAGLEMEAVGARAQRHDDFLQRCIAGALADAVDRAFDLARAGRDARPGCWRRRGRDRCGNARSACTLSMPRTSRLRRANSAPISSGVV